MSCKNLRSGTLDFWRFGHADLNKRVKNIFVLGDEFYVCLSTETWQKIDTCQNKSVYSAKQESQPCLLRMEFSFIINTKQRLKFGKEDGDFLLCSKLKKGRPGSFSDGRNGGFFWQLANLGNGNRIFCYKWSKL